ncbi:hypothetical protein V6N11_020348 [Hibiscus sabdariffa]|uniref:Uncharacterized protein n=1 Tax=Hibiscus sabdariffa TaxID=183260 RepID=A0ABR2Q866_9ROSI
MSDSGLNGFSIIRKLREDGEIGVEDVSRVEESFSKSVAISSRNCVDEDLTYFNDDINVIFLEKEKREDDSKFLSGASWHKGEEELVGCRSAICSDTLQCSNPTIKDVWGMGLGNHLSPSMSDYVEEVGESDWASQVNRANSKSERSQIDFVQDQLIGV